MSGHLQSILALETIDTDLYRGESPRTDRQRVFGGQVAGQALVAAGQTVPEDRPVHSLHAYFVRPGDATWPIVYEVERIRDGGSFTTRRVVARQRGREIFLLSASFQHHEPGLDHQLPAPTAPDPTSLPRAGDVADPTDPVTVHIAEYSSIDLRYAPPTPVGPEAGASAAPDAPAMRQPLWFRVSEELPDDPLLHVCAAAYASDLSILVTALLPHGRRPAELMMASLDHAMWFHRPFRADEWLLYDTVSPSASGGRGLARGQIFTREGLLVASVVQEGLMRVPR